MIFIEVSHCNYYTSPAWTMPRPKAVHLSWHLEDTESGNAPGIPALLTLPHCQYKQAWFQYLTTPLWGRNMPLFSSFSKDTRGKVITPTSPDWSVPLLARTQSRFQKHVMASAVLVEQFVHWDFIFYSGILQDSMLLTLKSKPQNMAEFSPGPIVPK